MIIRLLKNICFQNLYMYCSSVKEGSLQALKTSQISLFEEHLSLNCIAFYVLKLQSFDHKIKHLTPTYHLTKIYY